MYLFFDTETTGLPKNYKAPLDDFDNWPRMVQIAWSLFDNEGNNWGSHSYVIKPEGYVISDEVAKIHRVTQERAMSEGIDLEEALSKFIDDAKKSAFLVAHNIDFDEKIIGSELLRKKLDNPFLEAAKICTMKSTVDVCRIPSPRGGYKWPNLSELHKHLFQNDFEEAHDALIDVEACAKCFFELKKRDAI